MNPFTEEWPQITYDEQKALDEWLAYYRDTEAFDVSLGCPLSTRGTGYVIPVTAEQRTRSTKYAREKYDLLKHTLQCQGISEDASRVGRDLAFEIFEAELKRNAR